MAAIAGERVLLFPCNGNAIEAIDCVQPHQTLIGFVDDTDSKQGTTVHGLPVFGRDALSRFADAKILAVPGSPASFRDRSRLITGLSIPRERFTNLVHPRASVSKLARLGTNCLFMSGVVITSNAVIGDHVCLLPNTVVHHDAVIGNWTLIGSNVTIAGSTHVGENCYIGSGTSIMNGLHVGDGSLVGLGSNVIRNAAAGSKLAGNPAKSIAPTS